MIKIIKKGNFVHFHFMLLTDDGNNALCSVQLCTAVMSSFASSFTALYSDCVTILG